MHFRDTPALNNELDDLGYQIDQGELDDEFAVAAVTFEPAQSTPRRWVRGGYMLIFCDRGGRLRIEDRPVERAEARKRIQATASMLIERTWDPKRGWVARIDEKGDRKPRPTRPAIPTDLRWKILERDHHRCTYCGANAPDTILHVDHIVPVSKGGPTTEGNLTTACRDCNLGKKDRDLAP